MCLKKVNPLENESQRFLQMCQNYNHVTIKDNDHNDILIL